MPSGPAVPPDTSGRPPLGLMPRWLWLEQRLEDLERARDGYVKAGLEVPEHWLVEIVELELMTAARRLWWRPVNAVTSNGREELGVQFPCATPRKPRERKPT